MSKYIIKRLAYAVVTLFVLVSLTFFLMQLLPGDPFTGEKIISEEIMAAMRAKYGLDKPLIQQYFMYIGNAFRGDLGISINDNRDVLTKIMTTFPVSFDLGIRALLVALIGGVGLGIVASINRGKIWDTVSMIIALVGVSVPSFIIASILQYFLGVVLFQATGIKFFPITGWGTFEQSVLPTFAMCFGSLATISRLMRSSMLDVLASDYIKTAKAKGLPQGKIIWKHAVRNAILPVVTVLGPITASILTGGFVVENIFSIPGMGRTFVTCIKTNDYTMITGTTMFYGAFLIIANLIVDLAYGFVDPRVKLAKGGE